MDIRELDADRLLATGNPAAIDIQSNVILREAFASVQAEGRTEGKAGMLKSQLEQVIRKR